ncbi:hypothetical protein [Hymenobacter crusticola]|uniref:Uncharacterized protein n=1 Tax=Hymenobacter crusticola TaxID=1770526 RepID=A0A243WDE3_9BACT|nr:hypothetical protein [Hymenobacter crusticola]OUJ73455.1 hypothetical protein BXP70_13660 [Hymenobacter crusticola]
MKNKLTTLVPAVALLALSGCASTSGITSTENDGVYYSSKDRTTQVATASTATDDQYAVQGQGIDEDTNPEYSGNQNSSSSGSSEYYDDSYASRLGRFNNSSYSGLSYYSPVYTDPYFVGGGYGSAFSPYYGLGTGYGGFYDPFYSSFYSPFGYGFGGSYLSLGLGFGNYGGYRPYGLGYGGFYDSFYNPYYGGLYGGGYYGLGSGYAYGNSGYWGGNGDYGRRNVRYAPRVDRAREAVSASQPIGGGGRGGRYVSQGGLTASPNTSGIVAPNTSVVGNAGPSVAPARARGRITEPGTYQSQQTNGLAAPNNNYNLNERVMSETERGAREGRLSRRTIDPSTQSTEQPRLDYSGRGRREQMVDNTNAAGSTTPQDYQQAQRRSRISEVFRNSEVSNQNQSTPQRTYESRTYSQPTRTYSEPTRTYSEPARVSSPAPSFGGSSGGGGNFGGGGGGGGGRGRIR